MLKNFQAGTVIRIPKHSAAVITTVPPARQETIKVETPKMPRHAQGEEERDRLQHL
jgi:hypothetical protein